MALSTSQYVRHHFVTVVRASWGAAFAHAHNLNDGNTGLPAGYTPNLVAIDKAYVVDSNGVYHAIPNGVARVSSVTATNVNVVVGENGAGAPVLTAALAAKLGGLPVSIVLEITTRFAHSKEIGTTATGDEALGLPANLGLPIDLLDYATPTPVVETVYVRTTGNDANDGHTSGTAWLTLQKAFNYLMMSSPLTRFVLVDVGAGTFAGNINWDLIDCSMGYTFHVIGNQPVATPAVGDFRRLTIAGAVVGLAAVHEDGHLRFTPNAGDSWVNPAGAGTALADTEIGKVVHIHDATRSCYVTIGNVDTTAAGLGAYIDITVDNVLTTVLPAWVTAAGTIWDIIGWADPSWTIVSGVVAGRNLRCGTGSAEMASGTMTDRYCSIAFIQFTQGTTGATFESCDRLAFPGCRFVGAAVSFSSALKGDIAVNTVPQEVALVAESFFWPTAIWTRMGFTGIGTLFSWGGLGFDVEHSISCQGYNGSIAGLTWTRSGGAFTLSRGTDLVLSWCSLGPDAPANSQVAIGDDSQCSMSYMKLETQLNPTSASAVCRLNDRVDWLSRALAGANFPVAGTPTTHVNFPGGLMRGERGGTFIVSSSPGGPFYSGINSDADPTNYVVGLDSMARYMDFEAAHKATFFGCKGWLSARMGFAWFSRSALATWHWPGKPNALGAAPDIFLDHHSIVKVHPLVNITKDAVDTTAGVGLFADHCSEFMHGSVDAGAAANPAFTWGGSGVNPISVGAGAGLPVTGAAVLARNGSVIELGDVRINVGAAAGEVCLRSQFRSDIRHSSSALVSYLLTNNAVAGTEIVVGGAAAALTGWAAGAPVFTISDDFGAALGTRQACTYRSVA